MVKKVIRLTENDLTNLVKRVIKEQNIMSGEEVFELQNALNDYFELKRNPKRIPTDGKWGPATVDALKMFYNKTFELTTYFAKCKQDYLIILKLTKLADVLYDFCIAFGSSNFQSKKVYFNIILVL